MVTIVLVCLNLLVTVLEFAITASHEDQGPFE